MRVTARVKDMISTISLVQLQRYLLIVFDGKGESEEGGMIPSMAL